MNTTFYAQILFAAALLALILVADFPVLGRKESAETNWSKRVFE